MDDGPTTARGVERAATGLKSPRRSRLPHTARRRRRRHRRRWRRGIRTALLVSAGVLAIVLVLAIPALLAARDHLVEAAVALRQGKAGLSTADETAVSDFQRAETQFLAAGAQMDNPAVRVVGFLPIVGRSADAISLLTEAGARTARAGSVVAGAIEQVPGGISALSPRDGRIPLKPLRQLEAPLGQAEALLADARAILRRSPTSLMAPPVAEALAEFRPFLEEAHRNMAAGAAIIRILPDWLGDEGTRRYFVAVQNPAEARGTGGLIGVYSILTAKNGQLSFSSFEDVSDLPTLPAEEAAAAVEAPNPRFAEIYDRYNSRGNWSNVNITPDFPSAAQVIEDLFHEVTGTRVDGTIAVDPLAFSSFLRVLGGAHIAETGATVNAANVVDYVTNEAYAELPDAASRKEVLGQTAEQVLTSLLGGAPQGLEAPPGAEGDRGERARPTAPGRSNGGRGTDLTPGETPTPSRGAPGDDGRDRGEGGQPGALPPTVALGLALVEAASDGHLLFHSAEPEIQEALAAANLTGLLPQTVRGDFLAVVTNNAAANKADYYLDRSIEYRVKLGAEGSGTGQATVNLANHAPRSGQPAYVIGPFDRRFRAGENVSLLSTYCARRCTLDEFSRDGRPSEVGLLFELGHPLYTTKVDLLSGARERLTYTWSVSQAWLGDSTGGVYRLEFRGQPTIKPTTLSIDIRLPDGMHVTSASEGIELGGTRAVWTGEASDRMVFEISFEPPLLNRLWREVVEFGNRPVIHLGLAIAFIPRRRWRRGPFLPGVPPA